MLWCTYANFAEYTAAPQVTALRSLLYKDWNLYTETGAHAFVGWEAGEAAHKLAELMRQSTTQPIVQQFYADMADADVTGLPPALNDADGRPPSAPVPAHRHGRCPQARRRAAGRALAALRGLLPGADPRRPGRRPRGDPVLAARDGRARPRAGAAASERRGRGTGRRRPQRAREVLGLVAGGKSNREIADVLVISPRAVERHIENIYAKIGINTASRPPHTLPIAASA